MYKLKKEELKVGMCVVLEGREYKIIDLTPLEDGYLVKLNNDTNTEDIVTCVSAYYASRPLFATITYYNQYQRAIRICDRVFSEFDFGKIPAGMSYDQIKRIEEILNEERNCD